MKVDSKYIEKIAESESVFDMAAICYEILEKEITNPILFISQYLDEDSEAEINNPNFMILREFSDNISKALEKYSELDFTEKKEYIVELMEKLQLVVFLQNKENQLSVIFTLLSTIDCLVASWNITDIAEGGHLNKGKSSASYLVYMASNECLHEEVIWKIDRERECKGDIEETLNGLLFLKRDMLPPNAQTPEICFLYRKPVEIPWRLRVAVITGLEGTHFKIVSTVGSTKVIRYVEEEQEQVARKICCKMYDAIQQGAEFILLPEFCVSEKILEYIKRKLSEWIKDEQLNSHLIAVFPGSTWIDSEDNVQFLLDAGGRTIGRYYKNTPYRKKRNGGTGYQSCEGLAHPGYRTSLLWIKDIGYILPATCRDVIDGTFTKYLVQRFQPTFLMVPAWSSSGSSFEQPLERFAAEFFTNAVLCNGCGALKGNASIVGGASVLGKKKTVASGKFEAVKKPDVQTGLCVKGCNKLCSYMLELEFSPQNISFEERVRKWEI